MKRRLLETNSQFLKYVAFAVVLLLAFGYFILPMLETVAYSMTVDGGFSLKGYVDYFSKSSNHTVLLNTITVGLCCVVTCGALGTLLAAYMRFFCKKHKALLQVILMSPVMVPGIVIVIAFSQMYGESGIITKGIELLFGMTSAPWTFQGLWAIVLVITYTQYVYFFLNMYTAMQQIDQSTVDAAKSLGCNSFQIFKSAILPPLMPALCVSAMTTFVSSIGSLSAPTLVGGNYRVLVTQIAATKLNFDMFNTDIEVTLLLAMGIVVISILYALSLHFSASVSTRHVYYRAEPGKRHPGLKKLFTFFVFIQIFMIVAQVIVVLWFSFQSGKAIMTQVIPHDFTLANFERLFSNPRDLAPLTNSFIMAGIAVLASTAIALTTSYLLRRSKGGTLKKFGSIAQMAIMIPWCIPASAVAIGLITSFNTPNVFAFGSTLVGKFEILPLAYTIVALPLMLNSSRLSLDGLSENTEEAAQSLGASGIRTFGSVVVPSIFAGILSGAILVFVKMIGEYTMSSLLYGVFNRPISVTIITNMQEYELGLAMAVATVVIVLCLALMFAILKLDKRRFGLEEQ